MANALKSMILKMDESVSPAHANEIKQNTHVSSNNGYSKVCYINNIIICG